MSDAEVADRGAPDAGRADAVALDGTIADASSLDAGGPDASAGDALATDAAGGDGSASDARAPVVVSRDLLLRPLSLHAQDGRLAYWSSYNEQANQLANSGTLHIFDPATGGDLRVAANVSPHGLSFSPS